MGGGGGGDGVVFWKSFLAGNVGGMFGMTLSYPFDTVRVRMQTDAAVRGKSILYAARHVMRSPEGWRALYRGLAVPVVGYGSINAVAFATNDSCQAFFANQSPTGKKSDLPTWQLVVSGGAAGMTSAVVRAPIERVKTVMQTAEGSGGRAAFSGGLSCGAHLVRTAGVASLFKGLTSTMLREVIQFAMYYPAYTVMKGYAEAQWGDSGHAWILTPLLGGAAGAFQWLPPSYCVDVVKSRLQADVTGGRYPGGGMLQCARASAAAEGPAVFLRGLGPTLLRAVPLHAGVFTGYELTLSALGNK